MGLADIARHLNDFFCAFPSLGNAQGDPTATQAFDPRDLADCNTGLLRCFSMTASLSFSSPVPVLASAAVVVAGGGAAGIAAAIAARRAGQSVVLLERSAQLGGMATIANVSIWMPIGNLTGLYQEIVRELNLRDHRDRTFEPTEIFAPQFDPILYRHYLNEKLAAEGVTVVFHADVAGIIAAADRLQAVVVNTIAGLRAVTSQMVVDATGDARVAREAGVPCRLGRPADGLTQPMTLMFQMQDTGRPVIPVLPPGAYRYETVADLPQARLLYWEDKQTGTLLVNMTRVRGNGVSVPDRAAAEREGVRQALGVANFLQRTSHPNHILSHVAAQIGVRETCQIEGLYTLTEEDLAQARQFDDVVAQTNYDIDVHNPAGTGGCLLQKLARYDIPYRCLVPRAGPGNLIVAGRSLSATHVAMSSARVQPTCIALGQAAGCAAALAIENNVPLAAVPIAPLQKLLAAQGVRFAARARR